MAARLIPDARRAQCRRRSRLTKARRSPLKPPTPKSLQCRRRSGRLDPRASCRSGTVSLLYMTPSHQFPAGASAVGDAACGLIVAWASRSGCYVIEDDYDCDIRLPWRSHLMPLAALAPDCTIYIGTFSKSLGAGLRLELHGCPGADRGSLLQREIPHQQRQSLAGAGGARGLHAQWQLCRTSVAGSLSLQGQSRLSCCRDVPQLRRCPDRWRHRRPACAVASSAGHPGRRDGRNARVARARWRLLIRLRPRQLSAAHGAHRAGHHPRLCRAVAEADRKRHRAPVGRHRRRDRRSRNGHDRIFLRPVRAASRGAPCRGNSWPHDIGSNRLYAAGRLLVHPRREASHDKVPRQCRF